MKNDFSNVEMDSKKVFDTLKSFANWEFQGIYLNCIKNIVSVEFLVILKFLRDLLA